MNKPSRCAKLIESLRRAPGALSPVRKNSRCRLLEKLAASTRWLVCAAPVLASSMAFGDTAAVGLFTPTGISPAYWTQNAAGTFVPPSVGHSDIVSLETNSQTYLWGQGVLGGSLADWNNAFSDNLAAVYHESSNLSRMRGWDVGTDGSIAPDTPARMAAAYFPYSLGAFSATMSGSTVLSGNTTGISVTHPSAGTYRIAGLPAASSGRTGVVMPFLNGAVDTGAVSGSQGLLLSSKQVSATEWEVESYNGAGSALTNLADWSWIYIPGDATGVLAGLMDAAGSITPLTDASAATGITGSWTSNGFAEFRFGDGTVVNPATHALFAVGSAATAGSTDNIWTWTPGLDNQQGANYFGVRSIDAPGQGPDQSPFLFMAVPYSGVVVVPEPAVLTPALLALSVMAWTGRCWRRNRRGCATAARTPATRWVAIGMACVFASQASHAAIVNIAYYPLGEPGSVGGTQPYTPLTDAIGNANIPNWNGDPSRTSLTSTGLIAPGSTVAAVISNNNNNAGTWYGSALNGGAGLTNNWAFDIYLRPDLSTGSFLGATDGSYTTGQTAGGWRFWATNTDQSHQVLAGSILPAGRNYLLVSRFSSSFQDENLGSASTTYTVGQWVRATIIDYNNTLYYYFNGQLEDSFATTGLVNDIRLGAGYNAGQSSNGAFDELRVWTFDPSTDSLNTVTAQVLAVPEPAGMAGLISGLCLWLFVAAIRRCRRLCLATVLPCAVIAWLASPPPVHADNMTGYYLYPNSPPNFYSFWYADKGNFANTFLNGNVTGQITVHTPSTAQLPWGTGVLMGSSAGSTNTSSFAADTYVTAYNSGGFAHLAVSDDPGGGGAITPENAPAAAAFFPFAGGWTAANMANATAVTGNTSGISVAHPSTGIYTISGLPTAHAGSLMAFAQGDAASTSADNTLSTHYNGGGQWTVTSYDNDGATLQDLDAWSWIHAPWESTGIYAGSVSSSGVLTADNAIMQAAGGSASWVSAGNLNLSINGISPANYMLLLVGDSSPDTGTDNIWAWSELDATTFRVTSIDLPGQAGDSSSFHYLAVPYSAVYAVPEPSTLALVVAAAGCGAVACSKRRRTSDSALSGNAKG